MKGLHEVLNVEGIRGLLIMALVPILLFFGSLVAVYAQQVQAKTIRVSKERAVQIAENRDRLLSQEILYLRGMRDGWSTAKDSVDVPAAWVQ